MQQYFLQAWEVYKASAAKHFPRQHEARISDTLFCPLPIDHIYQTLQSETIRLVDVRYTCSADEYARRCKILQKELRSDALRAFKNQSKLCALEICLRLYLGEDAEEMKEDIQRRYGQLMDQVVDVMVQMLRVRPLIRGFVVPVFNTGNQISTAVNGRDNSGLLLERNSNIINTDDMEMLAPPSISAFNNGMDLILERFLSDILQFYAGFLSAGKGDIGEGIAAACACIIHGLMTWRDGNTGDGAYYYTWFHNVGNGADNDIVYEVEGGDVIPCLYLPINKPSISGVVAETGRREYSTLIEIYERCGYTKKPLSTNSSSNANVSSAAMVS